MEFKNLEYENKRQNPHAITNASAEDKDWVLLMAVDKPFVSLVWLGIFVLMIGFSISTFRYWNRLRNKSLSGN